MREDLISFLVHNITSSEWIERLYQQLKKLQAIKKTFENYGVVFCEKDEIHQDYIMIKIENS